METFLAIATLVGLVLGRLYLGRLDIDCLTQLPPHLRRRAMEQAFD